MFFRTDRTQRHTNRLTRQIFLRRAARRAKWLKLTSNTEEDTQQPQRRKEDKDVRRV